MDHSNKPVLPVEGQFKLIADKAPVLMWIANIDKLCYFFNAAWLKYTGRTIEQEYGDGWANGVHPEDRKHCLDTYTTAFDARKEFKMEYRLRRYDGEYQWLQDHGVPNYTADGNFAGYIGTCIVVDEVLQSETIKKNFIHPDLEKGQDLNEELATTNEELTASNEELIRINDEFQKAQAHLALLNHELEDKVLKRTQALAKSEAEAQALNEELMATNEELAATNEELLATNEDLYNSQQALQQSIEQLVLADEKSAMLAAIVQSSDDAIISKTLDGVVTSWNKSAERIFGHTAEEMIGQPIVRVIPDDRQEEEPRILARLRNGERVDHFETKRIAKDGRVIDVSLTISPVKDSQGNIIGASKIARDISEKKKDELRKNDFIGMVSHELKTPLTSLTTLVQVANAKLKNGPDTFLAGAMEKAEFQVKKMANMINGFLNVSRLESGKIQIDNQRFDVQELINEVINETELLFSSHVVKFAPHHPVFVNADHDKIASVLINLISNAVKYSSKDKPVEVKCEVIDQQLVISVKDEGMGIKPADAERLFERYYRVNNSQTKQISGFGIGLYLSAEIVEHHGGKIWVESEVDKGSTFYFSLPIEN